MVTAPLISIGETRVTACMGRLPTDYGRRRKIFGLLQRDLNLASVPRRWASGEDSCMARTTTKQVLFMRKLYAKGDVTQAMLAERFGLSLSNVKSILARRSWKHI
jgi:DNA-binding MarR family transcriptional regulator